MAQFAGSKTEANVMAAFGAEAQAFVRYLIFSKKAKDEGYEQIAETFERTGENERAHAKILFDMLAREAGTESCLALGAQGENHEWSDVYPHFARVAQEEDLPDIARLFSMLAKVEKEHEERFSSLLARIKEGRVFTRDGEVKWRCRNCGHVHVGREAPKRCPLCGYDGGWFEAAQEEAQQ